MGAVACTCMGRGWATSAARPSRTHPSRTQLQRKSPTVNAHQAASASTNAHPTRAHSRPVSRARSRTSLRAARTRAHTELDGETARRLVKHACEERLDERAVGRRRARAAGEGPPRARGDGGGDADAAGVESRARVESRT
eukprot:6179957-Pleurochrysis_carterae.AAC.1